MFVNFLTLPKLSLQSLACFKFFGWIYNIYVCAKGGGKRPTRRKA